MKECCEKYLSDQFGGDAEVMNEIYAEYVAAARQKIAEAESALSTGQWEPLDKIAHTIKGNALAAGDQEMADVGISLRSAAKLQSRETAGPLVAKLKELAGTL